MTETKNEPVFIVKLTGINSKDTVEEYTRRFSEVLPGRVVVVDGRVENIYDVTDEIQPRICQADETDAMELRDAMVTVRSSHEEFAPTHRHVVEVADVHAHVWPVAMGESTLLVEWDDGTLGTANLHDIRMVR